VTSQGRYEARQWVHGGGGTTEQKFNLDGDLGGCCVSARAAACSRVRNRELARLWLLLIGALSVRFTLDVRNPPAGSPRQSPSRQREVEDATD